MLLLNATARPRQSTNPKASRSGLSSRSIIGQSCGDQDRARITTLLRSINAVAEHASYIVDPIPLVDETYAYMFHQSFQGLAYNDANRLAIGRRFFGLYVETLEDEPGDVRIECRQCWGLRRGLDVYAMSPRPNVVRLVSCCTPSQVLEFQLDNLPSFTLSIS